MQCVILAGGLGTRMSRFTKDLPKALVPVNGVPFLRHKLRQLAKNRIQDILISVGYLGEAVVDEVRTHCPTGLKVQCVFDGPELLGTGGSLRRLSALGLLDDVFMVTYGDNFLTCDHAWVAGAFDPQCFDGLMTVCSTDLAPEVGNCEVVGNYVTDYRKNCTSEGFKWVDYGLSLMKRQAVEDAVEVGRPADLSVVFTHLAQVRKLQALAMSEPYHEIGSESGLAELQNFLMGRES